MTLAAAGLGDSPSAATTSRPGGIRPASSGGPTSAGQSRAVAAAVAVAGGVAIVVGARMSWLSVFAGMRHYPGTAGRDG
jgi:hypothetical protein